MTKSTNFSFDTEDKHYEDFIEFDFEEFNNPYDEDADDHSYDDYDDYEADCK